MARFVSRVERPPSTALLSWIVKSKDLLQKMSLCVSRIYNLKLLSVHCVVETKWLSMCNIFRKSHAFVELIVAFHVQIASPPLTLIWSKDIIAR